MKVVYWVGILVGLVLAFGVLLIHSGAYNVAADEPHWRFTKSVLEDVRVESVELRSAKIEVPALDNVALVTSGAGNYDAMCADCHLKPGVEATELSRGLYPAPPSFPIARPRDPAAAFWVIKHGIKMTGMPAWGKSMNDEYVWGLVAFVNELEGMTEDRYRELVDASGGHQHGGSESGTEGEGATHEHEPGSEPHSHDQDDQPVDDDHSKAPPHQH